MRFVGWYLVKTASYQNYALKIKFSFISHGISSYSRSNSRTGVLEILQTRLQNDFRSLFMNIGIGIK